MAADKYIGRACLKDVTFGTQYQRPARMKALLDLELKRNSCATLYGGI